MSAPDPSALRAVAVAANNETWGLLDDHEVTVAHEPAHGELAERLLAASYAAL